MPFTFHWYAGVDPPFVGVAVNKTEVPAQTGFASAAIATLVFRTGLTTIVTEVDVAGDPDKPGQVYSNTRKMVLLK